MTHLATLDPTTTVENVAGQTINIGDNLAGYDTVLYDPSHSADIVNGGVKVTTSGIYIFSFSFSLNGVISSGQMILTPTCQGAGDFQPNVQKRLNVGDVAGPLQFVWVGYLHVPAPDLLSIYITNAFDASVVFQPSQTSIQRVG